MRTFLPAALAACLLLGPVNSVRAEENPRTIIARAVKAAGGLDRIALGRATYRKFTGAFEAGGNITMTGEMYRDASGKLAYSMHVNVGGTTMAYRQVYDGKNMWMHVNGSTQELGKDLVQRQKESEHVDRVASLGPLLTDRTYQLSLLPEEMIGGTAAVGVKVEAKGRPDVRLFFDKADGLLRQLEYQTSIAELAPKQLMRILFEDYREADRNPGQDEEQVLKAARVAADGPALLAYLRSRTLDAATRQEMTRLVRQLGDKSFRVREKASADIVARGEVALPFLRRAAEDPDLEVSHRARKCMQQIKNRTDPRVIRAAIRLVGLRRPAGAAEALLDYLPSAPAAAVAHEVRIALHALAQHGQPDKVLLEALEGKDPVRRAAAAAALGRDGGAFLRQPGRRLYVPGLKIPRKTTYFTDGKKSMALTVTEVRFYNGFEDRVFARP